MEDGNFREVGSREREAINARARAVLKRLNPGRLDVARVIASHNRASA
jgi:hypothetical protein